MVCFQCDRLAADMAVELKSRGVVSVSLWPGAVQTELVSQLIVEKDTPQGVDPKVDIFSTANPIYGSSFSFFAKSLDFLFLSLRIYLPTENPQK